MARYTDADCKRCRREKMKLFLKGSKVRLAEVPLREAPVPSRPARARSVPRRASTCCSFGRSRRRYPYVRRSREAVR